MIEIFRFGLSGHILMLCLEGIDDQPLAMSFFALFFFALYSFSLFPASPCMK